MNHKHYERWLLSEEPLDHVDMRALQKHLESCASCRQLSQSWLMVRQLIQNVSPVTPFPGFAARWQVRLEADRMKDEIKKQQRLSWMVFAVNSFAAAILLWLLGILFFTGVETPLQLIFGEIYRVTALLSIMIALIDFAAVFFRLIVWPIPFAYWAALVFGLGSLNLLWIMSLRQVFTTRRVMK